MKDWEDLAKKAAYLVIGGTRMAIEGAEKALHFTIRGKPKAFRKCH